VKQLRSFWLSYQCKDPASVELPISSGAQKIFFDAGCPNLLGKSNAERLMKRHNNDVSISFTSRIFVSVLICGRLKD
jgi:hypothetical protein